MRTPWGLVPTRRGAGATRQRTTTGRRRPGSVAFAVIVRGSVAVRSVPMRADPPQRNARRSRETACPSGSCTQFPRKARFMPDTSRYKPHINHLVACYPSRHGLQKLVLNSGTRLCSQTAITDCKSPGPVCGLQRLRSAVSPRINPGEQDLLGFAVAYEDQARRFSSRISVARTLEFLQDLHASAAAHMQ